MIKNKKQMIVMMTILLGAVFAMAHSNETYATSFPIVVGEEELLAGESQNVNAAGTAIYDYTNDTLILNNYNGGEIYAAEADSDLTIILQGTNTITCEVEDILSGITTAGGLKIAGNGVLLIKNAVNYGIYSASLEIDGANIIIDNDNLVASGTFAGAGIYNAGNVVMHSGSLKINRCTYGIYARDFILDGGEVVINDFMLYGVFAAGNMDVNGGSLSITNTGGIAVMAMVDCIISNGYLDIDAGEDGSAVAIISTGLEIADNMYILADNASIQSADVIIDDETTAVLTIGSAGATIFISDDFGVNAINVLNKLKISQYSYTFIEGDNQKLDMSKADNYTFTIDGDYSQFESLTIGELSLEKDVDYTVTEGSTIINFTESGISKLNTLGAGDYDILARFTDKDVKGKLTILEKNPNTGDDIVGWVVLGLVSFGGVAVAIRKRF